MAKSVIEAFDLFLKEYVNLDGVETTTALRSRDWLVSQIQGFPEKAGSTFPELYSDVHIFFGSFERKTKIRELDDIDLIIGLGAKGGSYWEYPDRIELTVLDSAPRLKALCFDGTNSLNSRKVINKFVTALSGVAHYRNAAIHRRQEAATLNLTSYPWSFDIVPAFFTKPDVLGKTYYLIPDGNGYWKKTDPRLDRARTDSVNRKQDGRVLNALRLMKYWNRRPTMPSMGSYLLENMVLNYYAGRPDSSATQYVDIEVVGLFDYIGRAVYFPVYDPKGIQGDLNLLTYDEKSKISVRSVFDYGRASEAREFEKTKDFKSSIGKWREIFGDDFPAYF